MEENLEENIKQIISINYPVWAVFSGENNAEEPWYERVFLAGLKHSGEVVFLDSDSHGMIGECTDCSSFVKFYFGELPSDWKEKIPKK